MKVSASSKVLAKKLATMLNGQFAAASIEKPCALLIVEPAISATYNAEELRAVAKELEQALINERLASTDEVEAYRSQKNYKAIDPIAFMVYDDLSKIQGLVTKYEEFRPFAATGKTVQFVAPPYITRALKQHMPQAPKLDRPIPVVIQPQQWPSPYANFNPFESPTAGVVYVPL